MKIIEVIEAKKWVNKVSGQTASIYGAVPYYGDDKNNWEIQVVGYTWLKSDGTVGLGRVPAKTKEEAVEVMNKVNGLGA